MRGALVDASHELRADREVVLAAVAECGGALRYASKALRNDREVVLTAVAKHGYALGNARRRCATTAKSCSRPSRMMGKRSVGHPRR